MIAKLNPEPTVSQLAALARARRTGKVGNPKWYRNPAANVAPRAAFKPGQPARYVRLPTGAEYFDRHCSTHCADSFVKAAKAKSAKRYVKLWDEARGLKPTSIEWVRPTLGSFA